MSHERPTLRLLLFILAGIAFWGSAFAKTVDANVAKFGPIANCFVATDPIAKQSCRMEALAAYQAVSVVQVNYHSQRKTCQFGSEVTADQLMSEIGSLAMSVSKPNSDVATVVAGVLGVQVTCDFGLAQRLGGMTTWSLITMCSSGMKDSSSADLRLCSAYLTGMRNAFYVLSGQDGTDTFTCPPNEPLDFKELVGMLVADMKEALVRRKKELEERHERATTQDVDRAKSVPAAESLAHAMSVRYPCH
jgi:hypothetical protein